MSVVPYLLLSAAAFLVLLQLFAVWRARSSQGRPVPDTSAVDGEAGTYSMRVYYFYAAHCGPCRAMMPLVDRLRVANRNFIKVDIAEAPALARGFSIAATPSFVRVDDGIITQVKLGIQSERQLLAMLGEKAS